MRVALTAESFLPYLSGVTVSVDALARGLGAAGHEVLVVAPRPADGAEPEGAGSPGPAPRYAWLDAYELHGIVPPAYRMPLPSPWASAWRTAREFRPEIVHANSPFVTGLLGRRLAADASARFVFTHHTRFAEYGHYLGPLAGIAGTFTNAYLRRFWVGCDAIVAPSKDLADEIRGRLPPRRRDRIHVIPTGVDVAGIRAQAPIDPRPDAGWPDDSVVMASLGRLAPEKRPELLLEAMARAARVRPELRLLVIGGGPSLDQLRARAERDDLAGRVRFAGQLPRPEALVRLAGADVFAFVSRTETQGLVLAEALAAGLPAVAIDGPGVRDSVRDGTDGIVVEAEPEASVAARLAAAIAEIAGDPERRRALALRAREDADRFSIQARVAEVEALYRSLLEAAA